MVNSFRYIFIIVIVSILFISCEKEEIPITPHSMGNILTMQIEMESDYKNQIFYDLGSNQIISQNKKTDWDIGFESSNEGWHIILNTSRGGAAANTDTNVFEAVTSISNAVWKWDAHSGNLDSTAIGDYRNNNKVYIIDRGFSPTGSHTGYKKIVFNSVNTLEYNLRIANMDGSEDTSILINKDNLTNFTCLSFNNNQIVDIEPERQAWDILFTQYVHLFQNPTSPYLVTGALINRNNISVAIDTTNNFSDISSDNISSYNFSSELNKIGYNWKYYDFNSGTYTVLPNKNYIISDPSGKYFKLHFIDFYNENGEKGNPTFEIQEL